MKPYFSPEQPVTVGAGSIGRTRTQTLFVISPLGREGGATLQEAGRAFPSRFPPPRRRGSPPTQKLLPKLGGLSIIPLHSCILSPLTV